MSPKRQAIKIRARNTLCAIFVCLALTPLAVAQQDDLQSIQALIKQTKQKLDEKMQSSERISQELKLAELEIAETATLLNKTDAELRDTREQKRDIEQQINTYKQAIAQQKHLLAGQLKSAYMAGNYDFAKMFFNQDDAGRFERVLTYYQYVNKARQAEISKFMQTVEKLDAATLSLQQKTEELQVLVSTQKSQSSQLREQQKQRQLRLRSLDQEIQTDTARVEKLQQEEQALKAAIEQAEIDARQRTRDEDIELLGLQAQKGRLTRPASGRYNALFGKRRQGQVLWKGVIFNSAEGSPVRSVSAGKVIYADWLKGFGLVIIIDHGKGFMTVYGRNQALLRQAGDVVNSGDTVALVGKSGGQTTASLYFEIRHKGKALNPARWLARR